MSALNKNILEYPFYRHAHDSIKSVKVICGSLSKKKNIFPVDDANEVSCKSILLDSTVIFVELSISRVTTWFTFIRSNNNVAR